MTPSIGVGRFEKGMRTRREVLGDTYVDRTLAEESELTAPLQELVTEFAWGTVWARDGLDRRTRSLITLAMLTALNRPHELRIHLRGAVNNGCSREEIREVLLHSAVYCGFPAAIDALRLAEDVLAEQD